MVLKVPIFGNDATFCGILSNNLLPQPSFDEFHKSFNNLTYVFAENSMLGIAETKADE